MPTRSLREAASLPEETRLDSLRPAIAIVGSHRLMGELLAGALRASGRFTARLVLGDARAGEALRADPPDAVVLDVAAVDEGLGRLAGGVRRAAPAAPLLLVVDRADAATAEAAVRLGIEGLLDESSSTASVVMALEQLLAGQTVFPAGTARRLAPTPAGLSARQRDVLRLIAQGRSNADIARELYITVNTVKFHVRTLFRELGIHNRVQASQRYAELHGMGLL